MIRTLCLLFFVLFITCAFGQSGIQKKYPLLIEFYSIGSGVPDNKPVYDFIRYFKRRQNIKGISLDHVGPLGREGEYDLCFTLGELSKKQRSLFIQNLKKVIAGIKDRGGIRIKENEKLPIGYNSTMVSKEYL